MHFLFPIIPQFPSLDAGCPPSCSMGWWSCTPVDFQFCDCIPRSVCQDGQQHCHDWSDEYTCPKIS